MQSMDMKRQKSFMNQMPVGTLFLFTGDDWLADLIGSRGIVIAHRMSADGLVMDVLACGRTIPILFDEFEPHEIEIIQN